MKNLLTFSLIAAVAAHPMQQVLPAVAPLAGCSTPVVPAAANYTGEKHFKGSEVRLRISNGGGMFLLL